MNLDIKLDDIDLRRIVRDYLNETLNQKLVLENIQFEATGIKSTSKLNLEPAVVCVTVKIVKA